jgi:hypothetical protein
MNLSILDKSKHLGDKGTGFMVMMLRKLNVPGNES